MDSLSKVTESSLSHEISQSSLTLPDKKIATLLSVLIDKSRAAMGWNRLPDNEQKIAIVTWYEILSDAGVTPERYADCYRSAQARESERRAQGKERQIVTPNDLAVEWAKVKNMHREIDESRLLAAHNLASCQRCFGTGKEQMPDGNVREDCQHLPFSEGEIEERAQAKAKQIEFMRDAMKKIGKPKPVPLESEFFNIRMECNLCHRRTDNPMGEARRDGDVCGALIAKETTCKGQLYAYKRVKSPV